MKWSKDILGSYPPSLRMSTLSRHLSHSSSTKCCSLSSFRSCFTWNGGPLKEPLQLRMHAFQSKLSCLLADKGEHASGGADEDMWAGVLHGYRQLGIEHRHRLS